MGIIATRSLPCSTSVVARFLRLAGAPQPREIVLHVVTETATHAGHLDTARELIDGKLHLVLTE